MGQYLGRQKPIAVSGQKNSRFSGEEACNFYIVMQGPSVSSTFYKWILKFSLLVHGTRVALPADVSRILAVGILVRDWTSIEAREVAGHADRPTIARRG